MRILCKRRLISGAVWDKILKGMETQNTRFQSNKQMLLYFLRDSRHFFAISMVSACLLALFALVNPRVIGVTIDSVLGTEPFDLPAPFVRMIEGLGGRDFLRTHLYLIAVFVIVCALLDALWRYLYRVGASRGAETLLKTMRDDLYRHIIRLPFSWHGQHQTGDIIQRCTSDVDTIRAFLSEQLVVLVRMVVWVLFALVFMFRISVPLTLIAAVFIPIIILNSLFYHRRIARAFKVVDEEEGKLSAIAQENLTGVRVVRAFGREMYERKRFETQNDMFANADMVLSKLFVTFWSIGSFLSRFQIFVIMIVGAAFCVSGALTGGRYLEFIGYNTMISWPIRMLGRIISQMSKAGISIERIRYIMNAEEERDDPDVTDAPIDRDIVFSHVTFGYNEGLDVINDVSFTIPAGKTVGILGATGSGKSTLMYLLERLYDLSPEQGTITIGGTDLRKIRRAHVRERIGMVLQEPYLFSRTLGENITIAAKQGADKDRMKRAARIAALDTTIASFSAGYETAVGERGVTLSGGQKQRTAIAQMLIRNPDVMIFDDSLSAVDAETDVKIRQALKKETSDATVILIAHRITTLMHADKIIVLDKGRVVEEGTHEELLAHNGIYKKIYDLQLKGTEEEDEA